MVDDIQTKINNDKMEAMVVGTKSKPRGSEDMHLTVGGHQVSLKLCVKTSVSTSIRTSTCVSRLAICVALRIWRSDESASFVHLPMNGQPLSLSVHTRSAGMIVAIHCLPKIISTAFSACKTMQQNRFVRERKRKG